MRRRTLLATVASGCSLSIGGCLDALSDGSDETRGTFGAGEAPGSETTQPTVDESSTSPSFGDRLQVGEAELRVYGPAVQESFFHLETADTAGVTVAEGRFVFVGVEVTSGPAPRSAAFDLLLDGDALSLSPKLGSYDPYSISDLVVSPTPYDSTDGSGWVAADVPSPVSGDGSRVRVRTDADSAVVELPEDAASRLREPPSAISVDSVAVPESVVGGESIDVEVQVANDGESAGTARVVVNEIGPMYRPHKLKRSLDSGESATLEASIRTHDGLDEPREYRLSIKGPSMERKESVTVEPSETTDD